MELDCTIRKFEKLAVKSELELGREGRELGKCAG